MVMERTNNLEGFYFFFFFFFFSFQTSHNGKAFFFHLVRPAVAKAQHTSLLFFFKGRSRIYPTLPRHFEPAKSGIESRQSPG